jgi:hypothetical protein
MAQTGFTPIQLYRTSTASAIPTAGNLAAGELAINLSDERLYFKNASGAVKLLAANITPVANGGTGTATPALVAGSGVTISGSWPNQTIAATGTGGTVTSVGGTGTVNGITLTGTVTSSGNLTLGGTLSGVSLTTQVTGTLPTANGGTGNTNGTVAKLATTNFSVEESGGKLLFKYGATTIASMDSSGNLITLANVTAFDTP